jgi:hypothetical protein
MKKTAFLIFFLGYIFAFSAFCQNDTIVNPYEANDTLSNDFGLFTKDEVLNISLRFDITKYKKKKSKDEYLKAILTYHINDKDSVNKEIRIKSRGEMRNAYCDFPPVRLNFKKSDFEKDDLKAIEKMKMVTHCESGNEENLLKEYLIYKLYNVLTETSFRVRMVNVEYIDTYKPRKPVDTYAFWIEPVEMLAKRINSIEVQTLNLTQKNILPLWMDRVSIFNYMIGNTDWSVPNQHNCKVLADPKSPNPELGVLVPYDFDYSGLVDAAYAIPYEPLGLKSVRERCYVGICRTEEEFNNALKEFTDKKDEFYKVINDFTLLDAKERAKMIGYLDSFYEQFDKRNSIITNMMSRCKKF